MLGTRWNTPCPSRATPGPNGPESATWPVVGDVSAFLGGIRALLLQAAHPEVVAGVHDHSRYREDPLGRLSRTSSYVTATSYGALPEVARSVDMVRQAHRRVHGVSHRGRSYSADSPPYAAWVHNALTDSFLEAYRYFGREPLPAADADRYVAEQTEIGRLLDADPLPDDAASLSSWIEHHPDVGPSPGMRDAVAFLRKPPLGPFTLLGYRLLFLAAVATLPERIRRVLGVRKRPGALMIGRLMIRLLRWSLGSSPSWHLALLRAGGEVPPGLFRQPLPVAVPDEAPQSPAPREFPGDSQGGLSRRTHDPVMQSTIAGTTTTDDKPHGESSSPPSSRARSRRSRLLIPLVGALVLGAGIGFAGSDVLEDDPIVAATPPPVVVTQSDAGLADASAVAMRTIPSVVTVQVLGPTGAGTGSGVVYDNTGRVLTNDHVVAVGNAYRVVFADGRTYDARLLGTDPSTDLAVLEIDAVGIPAIELGSTETLQVGQPAIAVGSPLGLEGGPSLSVGVISSLEREVQTRPDTILYGMLQTDAPITQGSSGGALVDQQGRLIGITTAVGVSSVGVEGIGFATPVEIVQRVADEIIDSGAASQPFLGITGETEFGTTTDGGQQPVGVTVLTVSDGSPAATAGLSTGDTITAVAGVSVQTMDELIAQLRRFPAGDTVLLDIADDQRLSVTLGDRA